MAAHSLSLALVPLTDSSLYCRLLKSFEYLSAVVLSNAITYSMAAEPVFSIVIVLFPVQSGKIALSSKLTTEPSEYVAVAVAVETSIICSSSWVLVKSGAKNANAEPIVLIY